eukprot:TRINITY_DN5330_c0_g2_i3.p1 TRINITY_DN5330_c0_g2~~TRINITY_DN5330_c0_g2_i3.p1  ORF type:complete len:342 (-),score=61.56 TRINITY_DN5330_c0_g2_i3:31-1056(-)
MSLVRGSVRLDPELQKKLERRLSLMGDGASEADDIPRDTNGVDGVNLLSNEQITEQSSGEGGHNVKLAAEVARLRVEVESLRRELETTQAELQQARRGASVEARQERLRQRASQFGQEVSPAHMQSMMSPERALLQAQIRELETDVAGHVVDRLRMEAQLRQSDARQAVMQKRLETMTARLRASNASSSKSKFFFASLTTPENLETDTGGDSLESCNDSLDRSQEFVRHQLSDSDEADADSTDSAESTEGFKHEKRHSAAQDSDAEFEAPLAILRETLAKLSARRSSREGILSETCVAVGTTGAAPQAAIQGHVSSKELTAIEDHVPSNAGHRNRRKYCGL